MNNDIPIIKLELEGMKYSVMKMLSPELISAQIELATDEAIKNIDIYKIAEREINRGLTECLQAEITRFFKYGDGRKHVQSILLKALQEHEDE